MLRGGCSNDALDIATDEGTAPDDNSQCNGTQLRPVHVRNNAPESFFSYRTRKRVDYNSLVSIASHEGRMVVRRPFMRAPLTSYLL
jgi:hypothetical protein